MKPNADLFSNFDSIREISLIQALDAKDLSSLQINDLYRFEQLTRDEYLVLDLIGVNTLVKSGMVIMSFQGMKRLTSLHQARLTKAINRLIAKNLLQKMSAGYALTETGTDLYIRLFKQLNRKSPELPNNLYYYVSMGQIQGPILAKNQYEAINENLVGRWFGNFRFTTKIDYNESFELFWISTNGSKTASLIIDFNNRLRLLLSAPIQSMAQKEFQLLIDHLSQILESIIDAPVIFNSHSIYEIRKNFLYEIENSSLPYAG